MSNLANAGSTFLTFLNRYGNDIALKYYVTAYSGGAYSESYVSASGNVVWVKGYLEPLSYAKGGEELKLLEAGKIKLNDSRLYINGSMELPIDVWTKIGIGSPDPAYYGMIENGRRVHYIGSEALYDKLYIRTINRGVYIDELTGEGDLVSGGVSVSDIDIRTAGRFINTTAGKGFVQLASDGNYYEEKIVVFDGIPQKEYVNLGSVV